ncbi:MAG: peptide ABC transporter substrate-binding protein [Phycisphaerae bacterium]
MNFTKRCLGGLAGCVLMLAAGCGESGNAGSQPEAEFVYANRGEVSTLDPNQMSWMQDIRVGQALFEGVYVLHPETLEPILGTAQAVDVSDDGMVYTITLREEAKWSNGDAVTSDDFIFAWRRMMREPGDYSYLVNDYIAGAKDYADAYEKDPNAADFEAVGISKIDDRTFEVTLDHYIGYFPGLLAFSPYLPLHEASMKAFERTDDAGRVTYDPAYFTKPETLVTNGAYTLGRWDLKVGQTLVMNENYWDKASVKSRTIRCLDLPDVNQQLQRYEAGMVDWLTDIPGQNAADMRDQGRDDIHIFPAYGTYFWVFNTYGTLPDGRENPLADRRVRQALTMAIDKDQIVDIVKLDQMPATNYVPANAEYFPGYTYPDGLSFDVERAKALLAEAGYPSGQNFPRLKLLHNTDTGDHAQVAQNLRRQWANNLGVQFDLDGVDSAQFKARYRPELKNGELKPGQFEISRGSWYGDYLDVSTFTDKYAANSLNNDGAWVNAEYNRLLDEASRTRDPQERLDILSRAEGVLLQEAPILPLYHYVNSFVHRPDVTGIPKNAKNFVVMKNVQTPRSTGPGVAGK